MTITISSNNLSLLSFYILNFVFMIFFATLDSNSYCLSTKT
ncbi:hypothetical protein CoNPh16_CDS0101 [Staphylococcus phage S-CoN_Ph16]|nr:hypothetical protein CoNPh16_CDS0101 [Staphylococcus phage S-CoN_Ph16]